MPLPQQLQKSLRARAHELKPIILVGANGLSPAVITETDRALNDHELIKVRLHEGDREARQLARTQICRQLKAEWVQSIGKVVVIYRPRPPAT